MPILEWIKANIHPEATVVKGGEGSHFEEGIDTFKAPINEFFFWSIWKDSGLPQSLEEPVIVSLHHNEVGLYFIRFNTANMDTAATIIKSFDSLDIGL